MERKLETFASFSQTRKRIIEDKEREVASSKRQTEAEKFTELLSKYNVASVSELDEEKRTEFFTTAPSFTCTPGNRIEFSTLPFTLQPL